MNKHKNILDILGGMEICTISIRIFLKWATYFALSSQYFFDTVYFLKIHQYGSTWQNLVFCWYTDIENEEKKWSSTPACASS